MIFKNQLFKENMVIYCTVIFKWLKMTTANRHIEEEQHKLLTKSKRWPPQAIASTTRLLTVYSIEKEKIGWFFFSKNISWYSRYYFEYKVIRRMSNKYRENSSLIIIFFCNFLWYKNPPLKFNCSMVHSN